MSQEPYCPPQGIYFRLLNYNTQKVIYSRTNANPEVGTDALNSKYDDQLFTLIPGVGTRKGTYAIKSKKTDNVLFSRTHAEPHVGHTPGNGYYDDTWFSLAPGGGQFTKYFRLVTPYNGRSLYDRTNAKPYFDNESSNGNYSDQHWCFQFEDMNIDRVTFKLDLAKIMSSTPEVLANQTLTNNSDTEQEMKFELNKKVEHTSTFEQGFGFSIKMGTTVTSGIPGVVGGEFSVDTTVSTEQRFGQTTTQTNAYVASFPVKAGPHKTVRALSSVNRGELSVPYVIHLSSKSTGVKTQTEGMWRGVSSWDLRHTISQDR